MAGKGIASSLWNAGFPESGVPFWGVPVIRTRVFWGLYWVPTIVGNYQIKTRQFLARSLTDS